MRRPSAADLYRQHAPWALRVAYLLTNDDQAAQDLVHDAFVKVLGRPRGAATIDDFKAFLRATLINLSRSRYRRLRLERTHAGTTMIEEDHNAQVERRDQTRRALQALPHRQRVAVVLRYFEGLNEQETAVAMDATVPAIKSLAQRAKATMRDELEGENHG